MFELDKINADKNLYAIAELPLVTVYDDNMFIRNDYDVLSPGQRQYLVTFFKKLGFKQVSGKLLTDGTINLHLPRPSSNLAVSAFSSLFLNYDNTNFYCVTPTQFAEVLFYRKTDIQTTVEQVKRLIEKCPYNIEWLKEISRPSEIEEMTCSTYDELSVHQEQIVAEKFKRKKTL